MNVLLVSLLLWIPFVLVLVTCLIMFLLSGYKRGLWRSLISLGVTAVSAVLSMLLSKLIAGGIAGLVMPLIPLEDMDLPVSVGFAQELIQGMIGVAISLLIFSSLLVMFCIVGKTLSNHLGDKVLWPKSTGMKMGGLGVRFVDAVVFSLLLVLPLYGTLATYVPVANAAISISGEMRDVGEVMDMVEDHPVVSASGEGPVAWVYDEMANASVGDSSLDIPGMMDDLSTLMIKVEALENADPEDVVPQTLELIDYLRTDVVDEEWCYNMIIEQVLPEVKKSMEEDFRGEEELAEELFSLCEMSRKDFRKNAHAILDFGEYLIKNDLVDADMDEVMASEEFMEEFGKVLNASEQTVGLKNLMIHGMLAEGLFDGDLEEARESLPLREKPADKDEYAQDARAFFTMMNAPDVETFREGLEMMPGAAAADPFQFFRF